jgi:Domain of unknown function (DUF4259)
VGTFGTGPFDSDGAQDLLAELSEHQPAVRYNTVEHMLSRVLHQPDLLMREIFPDEIVAVAALVAASLPGGQHLHKPKTAAAALPEPAADLAASALEALLLVAGPNGPWQKGWTTETFAAEARQTIDSLNDVLRQSIKR